MAIGIITEYNPFHNGHLYHLNKVKELGDSPIILVMSGNFTQRGILSVVEKYDKALIALKYGVDLVIELPFQFSTQSSDYFAKGALKILNALGVEKIVFGSESDDLDKLNQLADIQLINKDYDNIVKAELDKGINYPTAMSNALKIITGKTIRLSNDLLGLSYIKEIKKNKYKITPITIKRTNDYKSEKLEEKISSASSIRKAIENNVDITNNVPSIVLDKIIDINTNKYLEFLKYKILSDNNLERYQSVDEGIENRLKKEIENSTSLDEFIKNIKSKRYTYNKINRMLTHILCSFTKEENIVYKDIEYIRVLGFNNKGKKYLNKIKKEINIPIITNFSNIKSFMLNIEKKTTNVYASILDEKEKIKLIELEYKNIPIKKD